MKTLITFTIASLILVGCATARKLNKVELGMTKAEVIRAIGEPTSISAKDETEYLNYRLFETFDRAFDGITVPYYVRLINGRVDSYGKLGDFDSTQAEYEEEFINLLNNEFMYTELMQLKELKDAGILTEEEFEREKKEILNKY